MNFFSSIPGGGRLSYLLKNDRYALIDRFSKNILSSSIYQKHGRHKQCQLERSVFRN